MSTFTDVREIGSTLQKYNFEVFKEPRGVIRILQLVLALLTILVLRFFEGYINIDFCKSTPVSTARITFGYPFDLNHVTPQLVKCNSTLKAITMPSDWDFSSEAEFLFTTCWISAIFVLIAAYVYIKFREDYESSGNLALIDFVASVLLAVMWIGCLGAWGYGQSELKSFTHPDYLKVHLPNCHSGDALFINCINIVRGSVTGLTISLILCFLNFFLWAASLWFLYKETSWYLQFQRAV